MRPAPEGRATSHQDARAFEIETLADDFLVFVDAFEAALNEGGAPPEFAERLAQLQQRANRVI